MNQKTGKIRELVSIYSYELPQRNYGKRIILEYTRESQRILEWCVNNHITSFDVEVGNRYCDETVGGHLSKVGSSYPYKRALRVMRMLVSFQKHGDFEFRTPRIEYKFNSNLSAVIDRYLDYCAGIRMLSPATVSERNRIVYRFDIYLASNNKSIEDITIDLFEDFLSMQCTKHCRQTYKLIFREFYRFLFENEILREDYSSLILKDPKVPQKIKLPTTYTEEEIKKMIAAIDRSSAKGKRDYLVLLLAAEYGMRASDITKLGLSHIDWNKNRIAIIQNKTGVSVEFPLLASVGNAIIDYLKNGRPIGGDNVIIVNHENVHKGNSLTSATIHSIVAKAIKTANIKNWKTKKHGPHSLRHSLASNMLKRNMSIPIIKTVLGHQSTESTKIYLSIDVGKLRLCSLPIPKMTSQFYNLKKNY